MMAPAHFYDTTRYRGYMLRIWASYLYGFEEKETVKESDSVQKGKQTVAIKKPKKNILGCN